VRDRGNHHKKTLPSRVGERGNEVLQLGEVRGAVEYCLCDHLSGRLDGNVQLSIRPNVQWRDSIP
jgi:hypothetical protein